MPVPLDGEMNLAAWSVATRGGGRIMGVWILDGVFDGSRESDRLDAAVSRDACISWWAEPDEGDHLQAWDAEEFPSTIVFPQTCHRFALLLDIGRSGASMLVDDLPGDDQILWFRLAGDRPGPWAEAEIVEAETTPLGPHVLRIAFRDACPAETLREALCG